MTFMKQAISVLVSLCELIQQQEWTKQVTERTRETNKDITMRRKRQAAP